MSATQKINAKTGNETANHLASLCVRTDNLAEISTAEHSAFKKAVVALQAGGTAVFPTDTVYGLGVAVGPSISPQQLFRIKQRGHAKPVAWLVGNVHDLCIYGANVPAWAQTAANMHWPGALTLVVRASKAVPEAFQSEQGTIGLRMPASAIALSLIRAVGVPLATTSANISGQEPPVYDSQLDQALLCQVDAIVRGYDCVGGKGVASTVIDCTGAHPVVLRQGSIVVAE